MAKAKTKKGTSKTIQEPDSFFFLKLIVLMIVSSQWIYIENYPDWQIPIPIGLFLSLLLVTHEHFQIDRKIEYALIIIVSFIAFWLPLGIVIQV